MTTTPQPRLTQPGQMPAFVADDLSATIVAEAIDALAALPTGSATPPSTCTPWPA